jgi:hypothetical protein
LKAAKSYPDAIEQERRPMTPSPNRVRPPDRPPGKPGAPAQPTQGERVWRNSFFYFSALMGALALVDFSAGRFAQGLGDAGIACLMLSLMTQFPFVRLMLEQGGSNASEKSGEVLQREAERLRAENPWLERLSNLGWVLLLCSLFLRVTGME